MSKQPEVTYKAVGNTVIITVDGVVHKLSIKDKTEKDKIKDKIVKFTKNPTPFWLTQIGNFIKKYEDKPVSKERIAKKVIKNKEKIEIDANKELKAKFDEMAKLAEKLQAENEKLSKENADYAAKKIERDKIIAGMTVADVVESVKKAESIPQSTKSRGGEY